MNAYAARLGFGILISLLTIGNGLAAINQHSTLKDTEKSTSLRSFHETTQLAESMWAEQTSRFIQLYENGNYDEAQKTAQRAYKLADKTFGLNDVNTADSLLKLGIIKQTMGQLAASEDYLLGALVILEEQLSPDHPDIAVVITNLGNVYFDMNDYTKAEKLHKKALSIRENAFGNSDPSVAQSTYNLAVLYENTKNFKKAESLYSKAIGVWTAAYGPFHPYIGNTLSNLTNTYVAQSKFSDAIRIQQRTVAFKKSTLGLEHQEVVQSLIDLGTLYVEQGQYDIAGGAYKEALNIAEHVLSPSDPQLALLMYSLANIYHLQARMTDPGDSFAGNEVFSEISADNELHTALLVEQALPLYERAAAILNLDQQVQNTQPALQVVLSELAMLYKAIGENEKALATESRISLSH